MNMFVIGEFVTCRLQGRDTTDQSIFGISELLTRITTHHTSYTHIHISTAHLNTSLSEDVFGPEDTRSQNAERYTNYQKNSTSVLVPDVSDRVVIPRNIYTSQTPPNHQPPHHHKGAKHRKMRVLGPDVDTTTPPPQKHRHTTPPHHHITTHTTTSPQSCETPNSPSSRAGCLNMFVIMSVKGS